MTSLAILMIYLWNKAKSNLIPTVTTSTSMITQTIRTVIPALVSTTLTMVSSKKSKNESQQALGPGTTMMPMNNKSSNNHQILITTMKKLLKNSVVILRLRLTYLEIATLAQLNRSLLIQIPIYMGAWLIWTSQILRNQRNKSRIKSQFSKSSQGRKLFRKYSLMQKSRRKHGISLMISMRIG